MECFKISQEIYEESLKINSYRISDDIYSETESVTKESLLQKLSASYNFSGRYWIWKIGNAVYEEKWKRMLHDNEMQFTAIGFKYFLSYPDLSSMEHEFLLRNINDCFNATIPAAYFAFSRYLKRGDVVVVVSGNLKIVAWGTVESNYMFRPTRKYGCHYRKVSWNKVDTPFLFVDKNEVLYQIPKESTACTQEVLIDSLVLNKNQLPFGFVRSSSVSEP